MSGISNLLSIYLVKSRLNEIQKREIKRIHQQQLIKEELEIVAHHFDYINEHNFEKSDFESIRGKLLEDIKDNEEILDLVNDIHQSVSEQSKFLFFSSNIFFLF